MGLAGSTQPMSVGRLIEIALGGSILLKSLAGELQRPTVLRYGSYNLLRSAIRHLCFDLKRYLHVRTDQAGQMRDHLVSHPAGVPPHARRVENNSAMESFWLGRGRS